MSDCQVNFLVGPTAVGKTAVAQILAVARDADILACDAMVVYRGMDIGTAKPTATDRAKVRYWGLDIVEPTAEFSLAAYWQVAVAAIEAMQSAPRELIITGGTGLYVKALTEGFDERPGPNLIARSRWETLWRAQGIGVLQAALRERSPAHYARLSDPQNPRRLIRALEQAATGIDTADRAWDRGAARPAIAGLRMPVTLLHQRIRQRVAHMFASGLLEEVRGLRDRGMALSSTASQAIGYAEVIAHLEGRMSLADTMARIEIRTRQLAKRQMTWFRHQANVAWIDVEEGMPLDIVARQVAQTWHEIGPASLALGDRKGG